jgi:hypothetical protein
MDYWKNIIVETYKGKKKLLSEFTQDELIYEKVKCATDSIYVIETYFYIFDQTKNNNKGEIVPFILFPFQRDLVKSYESNRFNITNKYRQAGISTVTCAWLATYIAFNSNRSVAIVANKLETARDELMKDVTGFIDMLPPFLHPKISDKNAANHKIYLNNSQVKAFATNSLRGYTPTFLFWDEAAWCDNGESFWTGTLPTLATGGNAALVSCVTKDTMVWTDNGLIEMDELIDHSKEKAYLVDEYKVLGRDKKRSGNIIKNNGFGNTIKIMTEHVNIEGTLIHKLWSYNNLNGDLGYSILRNIKKEDYVALQYGTNLFGDLDEIKFLPAIRKLKYFNYKITDKFIEFLALFYYKGNVYIKSINSKKQVIVEINNINDSEISIIENFINEFKENYGLYILSGNSRFVGNSFYSSIQQINYILYYLDLHIYSNKSFNTKSLTSFIRKFKGDLLKKLVKLLIKFNPDKTIEEGKFSVKFNNITMGRQIQQILLNEGIISSYDSIIRMAKSMNSIDRWLIINMDYEYYINNDTYDPLIFDQNIPLGIYHNINLVLEKYNIKLPFGNYKRFQLIEIIDKFKDILSKADIKKLDGYVSKNLYWSKVINKEKNKNNTYDFSLPKNNKDSWAHSVIYNGILGHQTPNGLDPVFYKTYNNAKNGVSEFVANELYWYYDPRYGKDLKWKKRNPDGVELIIKEEDKNNFKKLINEGWKPTSPWYESMASKFNYDKKKIAQELECVVGDTIVKVKNVKTGEIEDIKVEDLFLKIGLNTYQVLNHNNEFVSFDGISRYPRNNTIKVITQNKEIEVTEYHYLIKNEEKIFSNNLNIGDSILTKDGYEEIINIEYHNEEKLVYDLINVGTDSLYLTNGIVSHNCSFLGSGNNFIDEEHIRRIEESQIKDPIRMEYDDFFWIWEDPIKDKSYVMTVDVSTGAGDDYSTIIILKQHETHLEQVAEFKHKVSPDTLGVIANDYGRRYNNAFAIVDITGGIGAMTMKTILDLGYINIHYTVNRHEPTKEKLNDYVKEDENGKTLVPGFVISTSNRGMVLTEMKRAVEANEVEIRSYRLVSEFKTFITTTNNRVADHRRSFNDDLIVALAMGVYVFSYDIRSVGMSIEKTKKMLTAITSTLSDYNTGNKTINNTTLVDPSNPYVANGWLFRGLKGMK